MTHPLHPVHTGRDECDATVAFSKPNKQICSKCKNVIQQSKPVFQCLPCDFKLCSNCNEGFKHPAHVEHQLFLVRPAEQHGYKGTWKCYTCNKTNADRGTSCYQCGSCDFCICPDCFKSIRRPLHGHCLSRTDVRYKYHMSSGDWCCDSCGENNGPQNYYPRHCSRCEFDLCDSCCRPRYTPRHEHRLFKADSLLVYREFSGGWRCDNCSRSFIPSNNKTPFHCTECKYDLCENCLGNESCREGKFDVPAPLHNQMMTAVRGFITRTAAGQPVTSPEEDLVDLNKASLAEQSTSCVICLSKPKNATIIHGATGHVCCCVECARELQRRGASCPICRAPIDLVIKQFVS